MKEKTEINISLIIMNKMNKKCSLALSLLLILFFFPMVAFGQEITVRGKVIEKETGDPLPGVSIIVEKRSYL